MERKAFAICMHCGGVDMRWPLGSSALVGDTSGCAKIGSLLGNCLLFSFSLFFFFCALWVILFGIGRHLIACCSGFH